MQIFSSKIELANSLVDNYKSIKYAGASHQNVTLEEYDKPSILSLYTVSAESL